MTDDNASGGGRGIPSSLASALVIFAAVVLYFGLGTLLGGDGKGDEASEASRPPFHVLVRDVAGEARAETVPLSGRTEAARRVIVRAETPGQIARIVSDEGSKVEAGDILCHLEANSREAVRAEASAALRKAEGDLAAAETLHAEGFASDTALNQARAARDSARAGLSRASDDLENIAIRAPFGGLVAETLVEPGDFVSVGAACAVIADLSDIIIAGGVPSRDAARLSVGDPADVRLLDGTAFSAKVRFVSDVADTATRAFRVELFAPDAPALPEGVEARATITAGTKASALIPRNALVFNDDGELGVRLAIPTGTSREAEDGGSLPVGAVEFRPVTIVGESPEGAYVTGLPEAAQVIVRGQEYVSDGIAVTFETEVEG